MDTGTKRYMIVRFYYNGPDQKYPRNNRIMQTGLTLDQAQRHCHMDSTHGVGWFDGYEEMDKDAT
jgi:hypothetical protein